MISATDDNSHTQDQIGHTVITTDPESTGSTDPHSFDRVNRCCLTHFFTYKSTVLSANATVFCGRMHQNSGFLFKFLKSSWSYRPTPETHNQRTTSIT